MSGNKAGAKKAVATNLKRHGEDFYSRIGQLGGKTSKRGGFACTAVGKDGLTGPERARLAGAKGGRKSRRGPAESAKSMESAENIHPKFSVKNLFAKLSGQDKDATARHGRRKW